MVCASWEKQAKANYHISPWRAPIPTIDGTAARGCRPHHPKTASQHFNGLILISDRGTYFFCRPQPFIWYSHPFIASWLYFPPKSNIICGKSLGREWVLATERERCDNNHRRSDDLRAATRYHHRFGSCSHLIIFESMGNYHQKTPYPTIDYSGSAPPPSFLLLPISLLYRRLSSLQ